MQGKQQERKKIKEMTLCRSCASDYRNSVISSFKRVFKTARKLATTATHGKG